MITIFDCHRIKSRLDLIKIEADVYYSKTHSCDCLRLLKWIDIMNRFLISKDIKEIDFTEVEEKLELLQEKINSLKV